MEVNMSITAPRSVTAASCTASTWIANTAKSAGTTIAGSVTKVRDLAAVAFRALAQYASIASGFAKTSALQAMSALKANPQVAVGGLAVLVTLAAIYTYSQRTAV